jgi:Spx/MgsR family transcriptional regulator
VKKARAWLDDRGVSYEFHDYKLEGIDASHLERWCREAGWETVLNRAGTTFRKLPEPDKHALDQRNAIGLMLAQPSMTKRPVLETGTCVIVGFKPDVYQDALGVSAES